MCGANPKRGSRGSSDPEEVRKYMGKGRQKTLLLSGMGLGCLQVLFNEMPLWQKLAVVTMPEKP